MKRIPKANESAAGQNQLHCDPVRLAGSVIGHRCHICAFFHDREEENRILLPFIKDALNHGQKFVHTVDPERRSEQLEFLESAGIDVATLIEKGQLEIRDWNSTHLLNGQFDPLETLKVFKGVVDTAQEKGFPMVRFATHMEWAIEGADQPSALKKLVVVKVTKIAVNMMLSTRAKVKPPIIKFLRNLSISCTTEPYPVSPASQPME